GRGRRRLRAGEADAHARERRAVCVDDAPRDAHGGARLVVVEYAVRVAVYREQAALARGDAHEGEFRAVGDGVKKRLQRDGRFREAVGLERVAGDAQEAARAAAVDAAHDEVAVA